LTPVSIVINIKAVERYQPVLSIGCVPYNGVIIILILHIRNLILLDCLPDVSTLIHGPNLLYFQSLRTRQAPGAEPTFIISPDPIALEVLAVIHNSLLVSCIARKVVIEPAMAWHVARH
jgi:hypothetical protein